MTMTIVNTEYRQGEGIPLVLVHAFPVDHRMWDRCVDCLISQGEERGLPVFPIYAPDMPGAGDCPVPSATETGLVDTDGAYTQALDRMAVSFADLIAGLGHSRAIWVGLSMGGYLVQALWRLRKEMVAGLALCDTTAKADTPQSRQNRLRVAEDCLQENGVEAVMKFARPQAGDSKIKSSPDYLEAMAGWITSQSPQGIAWRERMAAGRPDQSLQTAGIRVPVTLISGELDPSSSPSIMKPLAESMTQAVGGPRFVTIPDCGHFSPVEQPGLVAGALLDLLERVENLNVAGESGACKHV